MSKREAELLEVIRTPEKLHSTWGIVDQVLDQGGCGNEDLEEEDVVDQLEKKLEAFLKEEGNSRLLTQVAFQGALKGASQGSWNEGKQRSSTFFFKRLRARLELQTHINRSFCFALLALRVIYLHVEPPCEAMVPLIHRLVERSMEEKWDSSSDKSSDAFLSGLVSLTPYTMEDFRDGSALKRHQEEKEREFKKLSEEWARKIGF